MMVLNVLQRMSVKYFEADDEYARWQRWQCSAPGNDAG